MIYIRFECVDRLRISSEFDYTLETVFLFFFFLNRVKPKTTSANNAPMEFTPARRRLPYCIIVLMALRSYDAIVQFLEYGSRRIPPRYHKS